MLRVLPPSKTNLIAILLVALMRGSKVGGKYNTRNTTIQLSLFTDKTQCKAVGGPNKFLKLDCKQSLFFLRFSEGCRMRDSLAAIKETERSLLQLTQASYQGTYGFQIRMEDWQRRDFRLCLYSASARVESQESLDNIFQTMHSSRIPLLRWSGRTNVNH